MAKKKPKTPSPPHPVTPSPPLPFIAEDLRPLAVPIGELKLDPRNARTHSEENIAAIAGSLREFGQVKPIVVNRDTKQIEAGNGAYRAAERLGWSHLAVVWVKHDPAAARGFSVADNRTAELAAWDEEILAELLDEMKDDSPELFGDLLLDRFFDDADAEEAEEEAGEEKAPEGARAEEQPVPEKWQVVVDCENEDDQKRFYEQMQQAGRKCRLLTM